MHSDRRIRTSAIATAVRSCDYRAQRLSRQCTAQQCHEMHAHIDIGVNKHADPSAAHALAAPDALLSVKQRSEPD